MILRRNFLLGLISSFAAMLVLGGCAKSDWIADQKERCRAQGGYGTFVREENVFECWGKSKPASVRIEFNKEVGFKAAPRVLLYRIRYGEPQ